MSTRSKPRRKLRAFVENPRGFSSIIGAIFAVLIMITVATSIFMWTLSQNTAYNDAARQRNQMEADRLSENVVAANTNITFSTNKVNVTAELTNLGSQTASVVNLWVTDATIRVYNYTSTSINIVLRPGDKTVVSRDVDIQGVSSSDTVSGYFVTARGNTADFQMFYTVYQSLIAQGVGSLIFNFYQFRYYNYTNTQYKIMFNYSTDYNQGGFRNYTIPAETPIVMGAVVTNLDPNGRTFNFTSQSLLWCPNTNPGGSPHPATGLYIVKAAANGTVQAYSDSMPINLPYGQTALILFGSNQRGAFSNGDYVDSAQSGNTIPVFMQLHGYFHPPGQTTKQFYGQCIPFVSLFVP